MDRRLGTQAAEVAFGLSVRHVEQQRWAVHDPKAKASPAFKPEGVVHVVLPAFKDSVEASASRMEYLRGRLETAMSTAPKLRGLALSGHWTEELAGLAIATLRKYQPLMPFLDLSGLRMGDPAQLVSRLEGHYRELHVPVPNGDADASGLVLAELSLAATRMPALEYVGVHGSPRAEWVHEKPPGLVLAELSPQDTALAFKRLGPAHDLRLNRTGVKLADFRLDEPHEEWHEVERLKHDPACVWIYKERFTDEAKTHSARLPVLA